MSYGNFIDSVAAFGKLGIEKSNLSRDDKEYAKSGVDCLSSLLKQLEPRQRVDLSVMGMNLERVRDIKVSARQYSVEKVVLFPYPNGYGVIPLIRVYGGDVKAFFCSIGVSPLEMNISVEEGEKIHDIEKEYGIILYVNV